MRIEKDGIMTTARPGDWAQVGKHDAKRWMADGKCEIHKLDAREAVQNLADCAVSLYGNGMGQVQVAINQRYPSLDVVSGKGFIARRMMFLDTSARIKPEMIMVGLGLLQAGWQIVVPLEDYDVLARDVGSEEDRARTEEMIHDLRVPVYDPRLIFARRCEAAKDLLATWEEEGGDELAFLRALHRVKPLVNALPPFWIEG